MGIDNVITDEKYGQCKDVVNKVFHLLLHKVTARQIMTKKVLNNNY